MIINAIKDSTYGYEVHSGGDVYWMTKTTCEKIYGSNTPRIWNIDQTDETKYTEQMKLGDVVVDSDNGSIGIIRLISFENGVLNNVLIVGVTDENKPYSTYLDDGSVFFRYNNAQTLYKHIGTIIDVDDNEYEISFISSKDRGYDAYDWDSFIFDTDNLINLRISPAPNFEDLFDGDYDVSVLGHRETIWNDYQCEDLIVVTHSGVRSIHIPASSTINTRVTIYNG